MLTLLLMLPIMLYTLLPILTTTATTTREERKKSKRNVHLLHAALPIICILIKLFYRFAIYATAFSPKLMQLMSLQAFSININRLIKQLMFIIMAL